MALLAILAALQHRQGDGSVDVRLPQLAIARLFGQVRADRLMQSFDRLIGSEIWIGDSWSSALLSYERIPMPSPHPNIQPSQDWRLLFDVDFVEAIADGIREQTLRVDANDLRQLSSRYSVAAWLRYHAWSARQFVYPPDHWSFRMPPRGKGARVDVPIAEVGEMFGYDGRLPWSKIESLFVTNEGRHPVVERELARVGIDIEVLPVLSSARPGVRYLRVLMGTRVLGLGSMNAMSRWNDARNRALPVLRKRKSRDADNSNNDVHGAIEGVVLDRRRHRTGARK